MKIDNETLIKIYRWLVVCMIIVICLSCMTMLWLSKVIDARDQQIAQMTDGDTLRTVFYPIKFKAFRIMPVGYEQDFIAKDTSWITNNRTIIIDANGDTLEIWYGDILIYKKETK